MRFAAQPISPSGSSPGSSDSGLSSTSAAGAAVLPPTTSPMPLVRLLKRQKLFEGKAHRDRSLNKVLRWQQQFRDPRAHVAKNAGVVIFDNDRDLKRWE